MDQSDVEKLIGDLELVVDRLRSLYEQYFMGIEKIEPTVVRKDVDRRIYVLRKEQIRNTALRFRFHMLLQRYNTYQSYWQRICRDIESGTYKRHVLRAQRRFGMKRQSQRPPSGPPQTARSLEAELAELDRDFAPAETLADGDFELEEESASTRRSSMPPPISHRTPPLPRPPPAPRGSQPQTPPARTPRPPPLRTPRPPPLRTPPPSPAHGIPPAAARPLSPPARAGAPPPTAAAPTAPAPRAAVPVPLRRPEVPGSTPQQGQKPADLPDDRVRQLYTQYVETKRRQKESTAAITYDAVARSLRESSAKLREKLGRPVDFEVVVKDGRAVLRPVVK